MCINVLYVSWSISSQCFYFIPPESSESGRFSGVFRDYEMETLERIGLRILDFYFQDIDICFQQETEENA